MSLLFLAMTAHQPRRPAASVLLIKNNCTELMRFAFNQQKGEMTLPEAG